MVYAVLLEMSIHTAKLEMQTVCVFNALVDFISMPANVQVWTPFVDPQIQMAIAHHAI